MSDVDTLDELWPLVVDEAVLLIPADGAGVAEYQDRTWRPLALRTGDGVAATERFLVGIADAAARVLPEPGSRTDVDVGRWGSVLVVEIDRRPSKVPTRLLWFDDRSGAFGAYTELAGLLARHAGVAVRAVAGRQTLREAMESRHRIGQAQGILMTRYRVTADQAFAALKLRSQHTNTKLRTLAEHVIAIGGLPPEQRPG